MAQKNELAELPDRELLGKLADAKSELFNLRFQHATGQLTDYKRIGQVRKEIARIMTARRELEIQAAEALSAGGK